MTDIIILILSTEAADAVGTERHNEIKQSQACRVSSISCMNGIPGHLVPLWPPTLGVNNCIVPTQVERLKNCPVIDLLWLGFCFSRQIILNPRNRHSSECCRVAESYGGYYRPIQFSKWGLKGKECIPFPAE